MRHPAAHEPSSAVATQPRLNLPPASGNVSLHPHVRQPLSQELLKERRLLTSVWGSKCVGESTGDLSAQLDTLYALQTSVTITTKKTSGVHTHPAGRNVQCAQVRLPNKKVEEKAMRPGFAFYNEEQRVTYAEYKLYT